MKNKIKLLGYAVSPLIIGNIVNLLITKLGWYGFSLTIISILFCCYWIFIGYKIAGYSNTYIESALIVNSLAIMCYVTVLMSEMLQGSFVANMIRVQAQIFFLPMLRVVAIILGLTGQISTSGLMAMSFILMFMLYSIGFKLNQSRSR